VDISLANSWLLLLFGGDAGEDLLSDGGCLIFLSGDDWIGIDIYG